MLCTKMLYSKNKNINLRIILDINISNISIYDSHVTIRSEIPVYSNTCLNRKS